MDPDSQTKAVVGFLGVLATGLGFALSPEPATPPPSPTLAVAPSPEEVAQAEATAAVQAMFAKAEESERYARHDPADESGERERTYGQIMRQGNRAAGTLFAFHGEVLQAEDRADGGTSMLVATQRHGRGRHALWAGNIILLETAPGLPAPEPIVAGSVVYGIGVFAQLSTYPTQIGGSNTVPNILARYVHPAW